MHGGFQVSWFIGDVLPKDLDSELLHAYLDRGVDVVLQVVEHEEVLMVSILFLLLTIVAVEVTVVLLTLTVATAYLFAIVVAQFITAALAVSVAAEALLATEVEVIDFVLCG